MTAGLRLPDPVCPVRIPKVFVPFYSSYSALIARLAAGFAEQGDVLQVTGIPLNLFCFRHPEHIRQIYTHKAIGTSKQPALLPRVRWIMGKGSFIHAGGEDWKRRRYMVQPALTRNESMDYARVVPAATTARLDRWRTHADGCRRIDVHHEMGCLVADVTLKSLFSEDVGDRIGVVYQETQALLSAFTDRLPLWVPFPKHFRFRKAARSLRGRMTAMVERRQSSPERPRDLLSILLDTPDKEAGRKWTVEEITDEMLSLYFGASIMKIALAWAFYLLSTHPAVARKLEHEVRTVLGGQLPTPEDLARLPYTAMVFQETTRLYPPVWGYPRYAVESVEIGGCCLPPRSLLLPVGYFAHRHPDFWENPEGFDPERFAPERVSGIHPFAHYPFGGGPRMCLGRNLAPLICQLILATVVQRYALHFAPQSPGSPVLDFAFELGPRDPLWMTVHPTPRS
jgi:cytochrome P450